MIRFMDSAFLVLLAWFVFVYMHQDTPVWLYVDQGTGCEYLIAPDGSMIARTGSDYMQAGCKGEEE